jgi:hypothetical protein
MANLDWSQCLAVESIPGKVSARTMWLRASAKHGQAIAAKWIDA